MHKHASRQEKNLKISPQPASFKQTGVSVILKQNMYP